MTCGIYLIWNPIKLKGYVGQSVNIERRWGEHIRIAKREDRPTYKLYEAMNKYGFESFEYYVLEICGKDDLSVQEMRWIKYYDSYDNGYNMTLGGENPPVSGKLKYEDVSEILYLLETTNHTYKEIGDRYDVGVSAIRLVNYGETYVRDIEYPVRKQDKNSWYCVDCGVKVAFRSNRCRECSALYNVSTQVFKGENNSNAKISEEDVTLIISMLRDTNYSQNYIGNLFGIAYPTVSDINRGVSWRREELTYPIRETPEYESNKCVDCGKTLHHSNHIRCVSCNSKFMRESEKQKGSNNNNAKLTENEVSNIIGLLKNSNLTQKEIAKRFNVAKNTIGNINTGARWRRNDLNYPIR